MLDHATHSIDEERINRLIEADLADDPAHDAQE
jgi:hypothetical protein